MDNLTMFLYLKVLERLKNTNFKFEHTLFHLYRYLSVNNITTWERIFVFNEECVKDDSEDKTIRTLLHHDFIDFETHNVKSKGIDWLKKKKEDLYELNEQVNAFFTLYKGEYAYQNSCFSNKKHLTISCHLCSVHSCLKKDNWLNLLKTPKLLKLKNPYKSFSN